MNSEIIDEEENVAQDYTWMYYLLGLLSILAFIFSLLFYTHTLRIKKNKNRLRANNLNDFETLIARSKFDNDVNEF